MINQAILLGRVGKKEHKPLKNGNSLTILSVATSRKYKDSLGTPQEQTTWHNVNCFSKMAEVANKYVHVGDIIYVQGEIQNRKIESGERTGQYAYSVNASELKFIPSAKKESIQSKPNQEKYESIFQDDELPYF